MRALSVNDRSMALAQGIFYATSGLWPILNMRSFEKVTGPKTDDWLVKTVGALIAVTGVVLTRAGASGIQSSSSSSEASGISNDLKWVAMGEALTLGGVSLIYSSRKRISKVYLLDTVVEAALVGGWLLASTSQKAGASETRVRRTRKSRDASARARRERLLRMVPPEA